MEAASRPVLEPLADLPVEEPLGGGHATSAPGAAGRAAQDTNPSPSQAVAEVDAAALAGLDELLDPESLLGPPPPLAETRLGASCVPSPAPEPQIDPEDLLSAELLTGFDLTARKPDDATPANAAAAGGAVSATSATNAAAYLPELTLLLDEPVSAAEQAAPTAAAVAATAPTPTPVPAAPIAAAPSVSAAQAATAKATKVTASLAPAPKSAKSAMPSTKPSSPAAAPPAARKSAPSGVAPKPLAAKPALKSVPARKPAPTTNPDGLALMPDPEPAPAPEPMAVEMVLPVSTSAPPTVSVAAATIPTVSATTSSAATASATAPTSTGTTVANAASASAAGAGVASSANAAAANPAMDRDFIARNQIVERYLSGRLPLKGATDFERFCKENPQMLDELGLPERVNAGLRLLEASGKPEPWQEAAKPFWSKPPITIGLAAATLVLGVALAVVAGQSAGKTDKIAKLQKRVAEQPLDAATATQTFRVMPNRDGATNTPAVTIGGGAAVLADFKIDESRSAYKTFTVTIDRVDQGRVGVIHNLVKDSNGHLRLTLNSSALGPGTYQLTIQGLSWRGDAEPDSWLTIGIQR